MRAAGADDSGGISFSAFAQLLDTAVEGSTTALGRFAGEVGRAARDMYAESPRRVVETVMRALRHANEPYPFHGAEVAVRYCSPTNKASLLSPQVFAAYLKEPWYEILTAWDELDMDEDEDDVEANLAERWEQLRTSLADIDVLVRVRGDDSWTVVNWKLSRHNGRWLTDALSIN
uniref:Uncharacterized protein n=1 Tax=Calcidiscus leptoporus TaxID=127549 RepID=A0A7S0JII3_9EUKA|mmetsp:Transcript_59494/g.136439  ORF Transcript_59494/g.136439 Transcript_59494/m.136439 type:complete len:175 (+) Transcript_59494:251-775(+)